MISVVVNAVITDEITSVSGGGEGGGNANDHVHVGYELGFYSDPCTTVP